jgi:hypothetical protein
MEFSFTKPYALNQDIFSPMPQAPVWSAGRPGPAASGSQGGQAPIFQTLLQIAEKLKFRIRASLYNLRKKSVSYPGTVERCQKSFKSFAR